MGVYLNLAAISDENVSLLLDEPRLIWNVVFPDYDLPQMALSGHNPPSRHVLQAEPIQLRMTLGEYWHGIHYLLCGEAWSGEFPDTFLLDGGYYVGDIDLGYGPARMFDSYEVKRIADTIGQRTPTELKRNFDPNWMLDADVYPNTWENDEALNACLERFHSLQHFMRHTVENNFGLALYLNRVH